MSLIVKIFTIAFKSEMWGKREWLRGNNIFKHEKGTKERKLSQFTLNLTLIAEILHLKG